MTINRFEDKFPRLWQEATLPPKPEESKVEVPRVTRIFDHKGTTTIIQKNGAVANVVQLDNMETHYLVEALIEILHRRNEA